MAIAYGSTFTTSTGHSSLRVCCNYVESIDSYGVNTVSYYYYLEVTTGDFTGSNGSVSWSSNTFKINGVGTYEQSTTNTLTIPANGYGTIPSASGGYSKGTSTLEAFTLYGGTPSTASFNLNILLPDDSEPHTTGAAGTVQFSADGGLSYSTVYNEPASLYTIGTVFKFKNFSPGTGLKLSSVDGASLGSDGVYTATLTSYGLTVDFHTEYQTYTNSIGHWASGFKYGEGHVDSVTSFLLGTSNLVEDYNKTFILDESNAVTIPNGYYLRNSFRTQSIDGEWKAYDFPYTVTQINASMDFEYWYDPYDYNITYNLNGGTNSSNNPNTYNVLYGVQLNNPTRNGYIFKGWRCETEAKTIQMEASDSNYHWHSILNNIQPGITYNVSIDSASIGETTATVSYEFTAYIYDFSGVGTLASTTVALNTFDIIMGGQITFSLTCPNTADSTHDIRLIIYAGLAGDTSGRKATYNNVKVGYDLGLADIIFDSSNVTFVEDSAIVSDTGEYTADYANYAATPDLIPIEGGITLYSNMVICGIYTYDADGNYIKRESSYATIHPISSNAAYMRVELYTGGDITLDDYKSNLVIENAIGINVGDNATFSSSSDLYNQLSTRMTGNVTLTALWKALNIAYYKQNNEWILCKTYVKSNGEWKPAIMQVKTDGDWNYQI